MMMELGAVSDPLDEGFARRRNGEPFPSTWDCPNTSSTARGRMRTANGRVISSGTSAAPNRLFSVMPTLYNTASNIGSIPDRPPPSHFAPAPAGGCRRRQSLVTT